MLRTRYESSSLWSLRCYWIIIVWSLVIIVFKCLEQLKVCLVQPLEPSVLLDIVSSYVVIVLACLEQLNVCLVQPLEPSVLLDIVSSYVISVLACLEQSMSALLDNYCLVSYDCCF